MGVFILPPPPCIHNFFSKKKLRFQEKKTILEIPCVRSGYVRLPAKFQFAGFFLFSTLTQTQENASNVGKSHVNYYL